MPDASSPDESTSATAPADAVAVPAPAAAEQRPALDPTRYGDWEKNGRCIDF